MAGNTNPISPFLIDFLLVTNHQSIAVKLQPATSTDGRPHSGMGEEETTTIKRRVTRSSSGPTPSSEAPPRASNPQSLSVEDLVFHDEYLSLDGLICSFPGRQSQILELINLLGPTDCPMLPLFVYGGTSTGKTSIVLQIFKYLNRPFAYCSFVSCYSLRILFESILNQLLLRKTSEHNRHSGANRCEKPSDFINLLREALTNLVSTLKGNLEKCSSKKLSSRVNGRMVYLIFDHFEVAREWDKSFSLVPLLFNLYRILNMPEVGIVFLSRTSLDTFHSDTGHVEPFPVYFPDYTEEDLRQIFMRNQPKPKLYSAFLDLVLRPFCRITRRIDELSTVFSTLFKKYCEPLGDVGTVLSEEVKRKLFSHLQPHIARYLKETFSFPSQPLMSTSTNQDKIMNKGTGKKPGYRESSDVMDFHMSASVKYLLISAFLASRNPATLDASLFDSTGGSDNRKRKRKVSEKSLEQKEIKEQELLMKGPGTFPLERLLAVFQCITSVDYSSDDQELHNSNLAAEGFDCGLMPNILLQLSSLCSANFISKGKNCPLEGSTRYRSTVSEDMALMVARSLKFPLSKYLYRK